MEAIPRERERGERSREFVPRKRILEKQPLSYAVARDSQSVKRRNSEAVAVAVHPAPLMLEDMPA